MLPFLFLFFKVSLYRMIELSQSLAIVEGGYDDMTNLNHLHEAAILHNLLTRFRSDIVYTYR